MKFFILAFTFLIAATSVQAIVVNLHRPPIRHPHHPRPLPPRYPIYPVYPPVYAPPIYVPPVYIPQAYVYTCYVRNAYSGISYYGIGYDMPTATLNAHAACPSNGLACVYLGCR